MQNIYKKFKIVQGWFMVKVQGKKSNILSCKKDKICVFFWFKVKIVQGGSM